MHAPDPRSVPDLERRVLGAAMLDRAAAATLVASLPAGRFLETEHKVLAYAMGRMLRDGHAVTHETLTTRELGGDSLDFATIAAAHALAGSPESIAHDIDLLNRAWTARELRTVLMRAAARARDAEEGRVSAADVARQIQTDIAQTMLQGEGTADRGTAIALAVDEALARVDEWQAGEQADFAPSGFYTFDRVIGGYPRGELTTIAGFTGAGKTALICQIVRSVALAEKAHAEANLTLPAPCVVFSAEMSREQIAHRIAAGLARVNLRDLRARKVGASEYDRYRTALRTVAALPIEVDDEPSPTFAHIHARLEQYRQDAPDGRLAVVAVDYDEKLETEGASEELRVSAIARGLKNTAKRFHVAVVGLSQYSRVRDGHRDTPADWWLRYSGKKEHESAMIIHWDFPGYWVAAKNIDANEVRDYDPMHPNRGSLRVTKNRFGITGDVVLDFHPETTSFTDPAEPVPGQVRESYPVSSSEPF